MSARSSIFDLCRDGEEHGVRRMITADKDVVHVRDPYNDNRTPLHWAAVKGHTAIVQLLLNAGADKDAEDHYNETPLHDAAIRGHTVIVQLLLQAGADKNSKDNNNGTPLYWAAGNNNIAIVQLLLQVGADKDVKNICSRTPLHFAINRGYTDIAQLLVQGGANPNIKDNYGKIAFELQARFDGAGIGPAVRTFMEATWYTTPMHKACYEDNVDGLRALVKSLSQSEAETQIGQRDHHGWTALHVAVVMNHIEIVNVLVSSSVDIINIPDAFGRTPLDYAAYHGRFESLVRLVELGANTDTEDHRSSPFNSLIYAACNGNIDCADFLIYYGGHLLKSTLEEKGIFPTPISLDNQKACRALLASSRDYTDHVISVIAAVKQSDVLAGPSWLKGP